MRPPPIIRSAIQAAIRSAGYVLQPRPDDMDPEFVPIYKSCAQFTLTSVERMYALYKAVEYVVRQNVAGDFVECGVWRGGSSMLAASTLARFGSTDRSLYLYDTYAGMTKPTALDVDWRSEPADARWRRLQRENYNAMGYAPLEEVRENLARTGYPIERVHFVQGRVEETIPTTIPDSIALLRLDTDWYESTYHELCHLYPRLEAEGVLIVDDYGHWRGSRAAVDRYFAESAPAILLNRIDYSGRIGVKPPAHR